MDPSQLEHVQPSVQHTLQNYKQFICQCKDFVTTCTYEWEFTKGLSNVLILTIMLTCDKMAT